jgi:ABC-type histidine transport system ATPase subunit
MQALAEEGATMVVVTYEMALGGRLPTVCGFSAMGKVVEDRPPSAFFDRPRGSARDSS